MTETYTIAHLTDAHRPAHGTFAAGELVGKRAFSALNWRRGRRFVHRLEIADALRDDVLAHTPDHVAMTGDVVNFGLPREFDAGADWLRGFGPPDDVSFVPGNHEAIHAGVEADCEAAFHPFTASDDGVDGPAWPWLRRRGPAALIGVSTSVATAPFLAQGVAGAQQIDGLRRRLAECRGLIRIVLIHHPPTAMSSPRRALRDREAVAAAIAEEGAELILHGHNHKNQLSWIDGASGRIPVLGAPAASTPAGLSHEPAEWRLITLRKGAAEAAFDIRRRAIGVDGDFHDVGLFTLTAPQPPA